MKIKVLKYKSSQNKWTTLKVAVILLVVLLIALFYETCCTTFKGYCYPESSLLKINIYEISSSTISCGEQSHLTEYTLVAAIIFAKIDFAICLLSSSSISWIFDTYLKFSAPLASILLFLDLAVHQYNFWQYTVDLLCIKNFFLFFVA